MASRRAVKNQYPIIFYNSIHLERMQSSKQPSSDCRMIRINERSNYAGRTYSRRKAVSGSTFDYLHFVQSSTDFRIPA
jgi:hypothetical protein